MAWMLLLSLLWGFAAHGFVMLNKFSFGDEIEHLFDVGFTTSSGRWFLEGLSQIVLFLFGGSHCSNPLLNGLLTLLFIGLSMWMLCELFEIRSRWAQILLVGFAVVFPGTTALMGYMFTAPYYMAALSMVVAGSCLICRGESLKKALLGGALITLGTGVYQAYLAVVLCIFLLYFLRWTVTAEDFTPKKALCRIAYYIAACGVFMAWYFLMSKLCLTLQGEALTEYMGISDMGTSSPLNYVQRAKRALTMFLAPPRNSGWDSLYPFRSVWLYYGDLVLIGVYALALLVRMFRKNRARGAFLLLALLAYPFAVNFAYIITGEWPHVLMLYSHIMLPILLVCLTDLCPVKRGTQATAVLLVFLCASFLRYSNFCYTRFAFVEEWSMNYLNRFVSRIESTPGYQDTMPVVYIGNNILAETLPDIPEFEAEQLIPMVSPRERVASHWKENLMYRCAFSPVEADPALFQDDPRVQAMPAYPADGSIRVIDGTVVVKLKEE